MATMGSEQPLDMLLIIAYDIVLYCVTFVEPLVCQGKASVKMEW